MERFTNFLNKFNSSEELRETAIQANIHHLPAVQNKIQELTLQETLDNQIIQVLNDPKATQQVVKELESMQESPGNTVDSSTLDAAESEPGTSTQNATAGKPLKKQRKNESGPSTQNASADKPGKRKNETPNEPSNKRTNYTVEESVHNFTVVSRPSRSFKKGVFEKTFTAKFNEAMNGTPIKNLNTELEAIFTNVLEEAHKEFDSRDLARVFIHHPGLHKAIIVTPQTLGTLTPQLILDTVKATLQSNQGLEVNADFDIHLGVVNMRAGS